MFLTIVLIIIKDPSNNLELYFHRVIINLMHYV